MKKKNKMKETKLFRKEIRSRCIIP